MTLPGWNLGSSPELNSLASDCPESLADEELLALLNAAPTEAVKKALFDEFYRRYSDRVLHWCYRVVRDHSSAADLTQEVFLKAYRRTASYRGDARVSTWMFSVTRNHCLTALKRRQVDPLQVRSPFPALLSDTSSLDPDLGIETLQRYAQLRGIMNRSLTPLEQQVVIHHYGHGVPLATLTIRLGLSNPSGAKAYIVNARRKLQRALENQDETTAVNRRAQAA